MTIKLTPEQREIERLHRVEKLGEKSIAEKLGVPRRLVMRTLDLPISTFREVRPAVTVGSAPETLQRVKWAREYKEAAERRWAAEAEGVKKYGSRTYGAIDMRREHSEGRFEGAGA